MSDSLFNEGGPHNIRRTGQHTYTMNVSFPKDADGRTARACPSNTCSPGYFKVKTGTGITGGQKFAYCPYCGRAADPSDFVTKSQMKYAKDMMAREAHPGILRMLKDALDIGPSGRKSFGGGLLSVELSVKPGTPPLVFRPFEEALQRAVVCPHCGLDHAVFGLAVWCSDCGQDIFMTHVEAEFSVIQTMLSDVERRRNELGSRVAARDIENCLEDTVSIYEAVLRALLVRSLHGREIDDDEIHAVLKRIGNSFQNVRRSEEKFQNELSIPLLDCIQPEKVAALIRTFEKRHPIAHNLGVVDRKYLERLRSAEREGREIRIMPEEISAAVRTVLEILTFAHKRLFLDENQQHK